MRCPNPNIWTAFYGGELEEAAAEQLADHLQGCAACRRDFDQLSSLGAAMRGALSTPLRPPTRHRPTGSPHASRIPLAVAAGLAAVALGVVWHAKPSPDPAPKAAARSVPRVEEPRPVEPRSMPPPAEEVSPRETVPANPEPLVARMPAIRPPAGPALSPIPPEPTPAAPVAADAPRTAKETIAEPPRTMQEPPIVATLERAEGEVALTSLSGRIAAHSNTAIAEGQGLEATGSRSRAVVRYSDGTRVELGEKSAVGRFCDRMSANGIGKWIELTEGTLTVEAAHQPADRAMVIASPHADVRVVGTVFRVVVEPGEKGFTRLDVLEGRVRLSRPAGSADVFGGFTATAAPGAELAARPMARSMPETLRRLSFEDGRLPKSIEAGAVERGPERMGNRFCVAGAVIPGATSGGHVKLSDDGKGLFNYSEDLFLAFDYWVDGSVSTLDLHLWSRVQQTTFGTTVWSTPREQWVHLVLPLTEFVRTEGERFFHPKLGEAIPNLWIQAGQAGGRLYLDNLEILRIRKRDARR